MNNETIVAVPLNVELPGQTRKFLVRLVEQLDVVLGRRGGDPYVSQSTLVSTTDRELTKLEQTILAVVQQLLAADGEVTNELLEQIEEQTTTSIEELKSTDTVTNANTSATTISNPPTQAEVQAVDARITTNANRFNDLLTILRSTEIIGT